MKFTKSEIETVHQYAAPTKAETIAGMERDVPRIDDPLTKAIVEGTIRKLERIPELGCSRVIAVVKSQPMEWPAGSVRQKLAAAKVRLAIIQGHDLSGKERFLLETRHMVTFEVKRDCFAGNKGERFRLYLSDKSYQNAKRSERDGEIKITSYALSLTGISILTRRTGIRNGKNGRNDRSQDIPLWKRAQLYTTWKAVVQLRPAGASYGQQMISVDF